MICEGEVVRTHEKSTLSCSWVEPCFATSLQESHENCRVKGAALVCKNAVAHAHIDTIGHRTQHTLYVLMDTIRWMRIHGYNMMDEHIDGYDRSQNTVCMC